MQTRISDATASSPSPKEQDLHRQLIEQFYKTSIENYGIDSEQTRIFAQHLATYAGAGE
jgi:hypothetical protein